MNIKEVSGLSKEEIEFLENSPVCLNCNHREGLHNNDYEFGVLCNVCECDEVIKEGDYSEWSIERSKWRVEAKKWNEIYNEISKPLEDRLYKVMETVSLDQFCKERELPEEVDGKVLRIVKKDRFKLPE